MQVTSVMLAYYKTHEKFNVVNVATLICDLTLLSKAYMQVMQVTSVMLLQNTRKTEYCQRRNSDMSSHFTFKSLHASHISHVSTKHTKNSMLSTSE